MSTTSPINGLPVPDDNSPNDPPIHFQALVDALDGRLVPAFGTVADRDAATTAPTRGMVAVVGDSLTLRSASAWRNLFTDYAVGRVSANAGLVNPDAALTNVITVPAAPVACRVTFTATGRVGNAAGSRTIAWDWDSKPASASNIAQDDPANRITVAANQLATISTTLIMDVPANVSATARLMYRANDNAFNYGAVVWHRGPAS